MVTPCFQAELGNVANAVNKLGNKQTGWLIDSSDSHRLWFGRIQGLDGGRANCDGLLRKAVEEFATMLREAAIEAEREFVEVRL